MTTKLHDKDDIQSYPPFPLAWIKGRPVTTRYMADGKAFTNLGAAIRHLESLEPLEQPAPEGPAVA